MGVAPIKEDENCGTIPNRAYGVHHVEHISRQVECEVDVRLLMSAAFSCWSK